MSIPESLEVVKQRVARDPQVVGYLHLLMRTGIFDVEQEFTIADEISTRYGISIDTFSEGCDIARAEIDQAILDGSISLF